MSASDSTAAPSQTNRERTDREAARLSTLRQYQILDTPPEAAFDRLTELAAQFLDVPVAVVSLIDEDRQWFKSCVGLDCNETHREDAFCAHILDADQLLVVEDATEDPRFSDNPFVTGAPGIRFYAGAPLVADGGYVLGAFCIMDTEPRSLSDAERSTLDKLAAMAVDELRLRRAEAEHRQSKAALADERERLKHLADRIPGILYQFVAGPDGSREFRYVSEQAKTWLGIDLDEDNLVERAIQQIPPPYREQVHASNEAAIAAGEPWREEFPIETPDGETIWLQGQSQPERREDEIVYHGLFLDVTAQKKAVDDLRETKQLLEKTLESLNEAVFVIDPADRSVVACNTAVESIFGYTKPELIGESTEKLHVDREAYERFDEISTSMLAEQGCYSGIFEMRRKDGECIVTAHTVTPLQPGDWSQGVVSVVRDVTERTERERALRRSRDLLKQTQRLAGAWEYDVASDTLHWTEEVYHIFERPLDYEPDFGQGLAALVPDARTTLEQALTDADGADGTFDIELTIETAKGHTREVRVVGEAITEDGELVRMAGAIQDVTDRKTAERALKRERDVLQRIFEASPAAIAMLDADGRFTFASPRAEKVLGLSPSAMEERHYNDPEWNITTPEGRPLPEDELPFARVMDTGQPVHNAEHTIEWPDGTQRLLSVSGAPLRNDSASPAGAVFVMNDITAQRATEQQMRLHAEALEAAANAIVITDAKGVITWVNPAFETLTGYALDEAVGETMALLRSGAHGKAFYQDLWSTIRSGRVWRGELVNRHKDGTLYVEEQTITPVTGDDGTPHHFIAVKRDITDRKRREQELIAAKETAEAAQARAEAAQAQAEEMNRLKSAFLANMSHEIRTPLTSIIGFSEVLSGMDLEPPAGQFTQMIHRGGNRLLTTLNSVLDLSQLEAGAMEMHPEECAVGSLVRDVATGFQLRADEAQVDLTVETPDRKTTSYIDPSAVERIASNLISNAIKFTGEGHAPGGSVTVTLDATDDACTLTVADTGVGIDAAFVPHLFDAFKQESTGDARDFEGSGLGLAITGELVDLLGGTISVDSAKGEGTTFTVTLPRQTPEPA